MTDDKKIDQIAQVGINALKLYPGLKAEWRVTNTEDGPLVDPIDPGAKLLAGRMANLDGAPLVSRHEMVAAFGQVAQWVAHYPSSQRMFETEPIKGNNDVAATRFAVHPVPQEPAGN